MREQELRAQQIRNQQVAMMSVQQQQQMRPPATQGPSQTPRPAPVGTPNGQPQGAVPVQANIAPSQQQLLNAVAAASAATNRPGSVPMATPNGPLNPAPNVRMAQTPAQQAQIASQIQILQAQQLAARQAQALAAAQQQQQPGRIISGGTPRSNSAALSASPFSQAPVDLPNGEHAQSSPAVQSSAVPNVSPQHQAQGTGRVPSIPLPQAQHLRVQSAPSPQGLPAASPAAQQQNQAVMQQILQHLEATGQQPTPDSIRAAHQEMRAVSIQLAGLSAADTSSELMHTLKHKRKLRLRLRLKPKSKPRPRLQHR